MTVAMNHEPPPRPGDPAASPPEFEGSPELWAALDLVAKAGLLEDVTVEMWEHIPEDFCRDHELDNGRLIRRQSGSRGHQHASLRLAIALEAAMKKAIQDGAYPCLKVVQDLDTRLWEVPRSTVRRPDVLVYRCLEPEDKLWARDVLLAVEIVSPASRATDTGRDNPLVGFLSKMTQYALAGIKHYWIVRLRRDDAAIESIEEWRLVEHPGAYLLAAAWNIETDSGVHTDRPFPIDISWADLEF
jgi:Uma2 family endonuclease